MPKYRIVMTGTDCCSPRSIWLDKATDEDVVRDAMALLRKGDTADVWSETALIERIQHRARRSTTFPRIPTVLAGLATTTVLALLLFTGHGLWLNALSNPNQTSSSTEPRGSRDLGYALVMDAASSSITEPASSVDPSGPTDSAPPSPGPKQARHVRSNPRVASETVAPRTALFPAMPHARTNIYEMVGSGFAQGGN